MIDERTPWHVHEWYPFWVEDADGRKLVSTEGIYLSPEDNKALARLIAAAPALLAACEMALAWFTDQDEIEVEPSKERDALRAAIAQARGEG